MLPAIDPIKRKLFVEGIYLRYGYDFREYSEASFDRRLGNILKESEDGEILYLLKKVLDSPAYFRAVLPFRDPNFYKCLKEKVFPYLSTFPSLRIWSAGCSTGLEVISLAILLNEADLLKRSTIYATDINKNFLNTARKGIYSAGLAKDLVKNYVKAGGENSPSDYYTADYDLIRFDPRLLENVVFSEHNLATDGSFVEAHLILCRNVLIYFTKSLQSKVFKLFVNSLTHDGVLGIGSKESLMFSGSEKSFKVLDKNLNLYQKLPGYFSSDRGVKL